MGDTREKTGIQDAGLLKKGVQSVYMDLETALDYEAKGKYYRFEVASGGRIILTPVKVPAHVIEARKERIRKKQIQRMVEHNRQRALVMNISFIAFMTAALFICCVVCYFYISLQGEVTTRLRTVSQLQNEVEALATDNDTLEKRIGAEVNIGEIRDRARDDLGMTTVKPDQIFYYMVSDQDYMIQYDDID